jgi:ABC-type sugar transport system permease subunit
MTWPALLLLAACAYAMKAVGPLALGDRTLSPRWDRLLGLVAVPLFGALILVQTITDGREFVIDSRLAGVAVAAIAVWRQAPFVVVVVLAALTSAGVHALAA